MLPLHYVKEIHSRLAVRYGSAWRTKWAEVPIEALEADWAQVLDGMKPEQIKAALANLPDDFPPTCTAFRKAGELHATKAEDTSEYLRLQSERGTAMPPEVKARLLQLVGRVKVAP
jgi:hypothetical protein